MYTYHCTLLLFSIYVLVFRFFLSFSSYLHCEWATAEKLTKVDKRVQMKIKRYFMKRNAMPFPDEVLGNLNSTLYGTLKFSNLVVE